MISTNCDFSHFVAAIKDKPYDDIIYLADQEATAAERLLFRNNVENDEISHFENEMADPQLHELGLAALKRKEVVTVSFAGGLGSRWASGSVI